ncbi:MAG: hypothetical protein D6791_04070 [Chloroflexi bacterium]|nr:MAG: hypothetical protein D6791_04070 [Chloroflexota bacterium]
MKGRITTTLDPEAVVYIREMAETEKINRSEALGEIIRQPGHILKGVGHGAPSHPKGTKIS